MRAPAASRATAMSVAALLTAFAAQAASGQALSEEPRVRGGDLVFPEGAAIPRSLTATEATHLELHPFAPFAPFDPLAALRASEGVPTGPVHCVAEYEPMEGLLIAWEGSGSWTSILAQMAVQVTTIGDADVYVVVDSTAEQSSVASTLAAWGVVMDRVRFVVVPTDTIWIRDYGPRYIYEGDCRAIVDHTYNRPRPRDNEFSGHFSLLKNHARYEIPLIHGGGNYHLDALGASNTSRLINAENPDLTEQEIHDLWLAYQNVDTSFFDPLPSSIDSTQHIDMWMQVIADDEIVISDWPMNPGSIQDVICDDAVALFEARGYTVHRVPARSVSGTHYTYTNVTMCNDLVLIPSYTHSLVVPHNDEAEAAWNAACPDKVIVPINCQAIVTAAGVMHCIVMHVPEPLGGATPTAYLRNLRGGEMLVPGEQVEIAWISDDDESVASVDIRLSTDGGTSFPTTIVVGTDDDGVHAWTVPELATLAARIRIVVHDEDGNSGWDESDDDLVIAGGVVGDIDGDGCVGVTDLLILLADWGACAGCPADLDGDGAVGVTDLLVVLGHWESC